MALPMFGNIWYYDCYDNSGDNSYATIVFIYLFDLSYILTVDYNDKCSIINVYFK